MKIQLFFILILYYGFCNAQDGHYWGNHFGTSSNLLSGVVIGSVNDLGAVYYNPGRLGMMKNPSFLISTKVYQLEKIKLEDALGEDRDLKDNNFNSVPELAAISFGLKKFPKHRFAFSSLTRRQSEFNILTRTDVNIDNSTSGLDSELVTGEVRINTNIKEDWFGATWSYKLNSKVSFGITNFLVKRRKSDFFNVRFQALTKDNDLVIFNRNRDFNMNNFGLLFKGGLAFDFSPITFGLVITTPMINLSGNGNYLYEDIFSGIDTDNDGEYDNIFSSNYQQDIDATYKSPWAIGVGAGYNIGNSTIHFSVEWYDKVKEYTLLDPEPFDRQSDGESINVKVIDDLDSVINLGAGIDLHLSDSLSVFASFATDFSAVKEGASNFLETEDVTSNSAVTTNFYHFTGGSSFIVKKIDFTLGIGYIFGKQIIRRPVNLPDEENEPIFEENASSTLHLSRWKFIVGFNIPFGDNIKRGE